MAAVRNSRDDGEARICAGYGSRRYSYQNNVPFLLAIRRHHENRPLAVPAPREAGAEAVRESGRCKDGAAKDARVQLIHVAGVATEFM